VDLAELAGELLGAAAIHSIRAMLRVLHGLALLFAAFIVLIAIAYIVFYWAGGL
jgi:hypothetical protein